MRDADTNCECDPEGLSLSCMLDVIDSLRLAVESGHHQNREQFSCFAVKNDKSESLAPNIFCRMVTYSRGGVKII